MLALSKLHSNIRALCRCQPLHLCRLIKSWKPGHGYWICITTERIQQLAGTKDPFMNSLSPPCTVLTDSWIFNVNSRFISEFDLLTYCGRQEDIKSDQPSLTGLLWSEWIKHCLCYRWVSFLMFEMFSLRLILWFEQFFCVCVWWRGLWIQPRFRFWLCT